MSSLVIRGAVSLKSSEFPIAGVAVMARVPSDWTSSAGSRHRSVSTPIGRGVTGSDGSFEIDADESDPSIANIVCALSSCDRFKFTLALFDGKLLLHETDPLAYTEDFTARIELMWPDTKPTTANWADLSRRMMASQTARLGDISAELATLSPKRIFADWSVTHRLRMLSQLEQALLDPTNALGKAGIDLHLLQLQDDAEVSRLREQLHLEHRAGLAKALDLAVERTRKSGSWREIDLIGDPEKFKQGDYFGGVNQFIGEPVLRPGVFPWVDSPLTGYRDYLRDGWFANQLFEAVVGGPSRTVTTPATLIQRLNNRFHQDFATRNISPQVVNRLLISILLRILVAPKGNEYGFGVAPASIDAQGSLSDRDYLDHLVSLTGLKVEEVEKRYRLNLGRSDLETSNLVQQNIETLQRFFTDSYQSVEDPIAIKPDRKAGVDELLIVKFPVEGAGPFFLEFEEWLAREDSFYPENHYDPRATYKWTTDDKPAQKTRDSVFANSVPLAEAADRTPDNAKFVPGRAGYDHRFAKWQWVRNHLDLQDLIEAAHGDAKSLNYVAAELKYTLALEWTKKLQRLISFSPVGWWDYDPAVFTKTRKSIDVSSMDALTMFEQSSHLYLGWHYGLVAEYGDLLPGNAEISEPWWRNKKTVAYLLDLLAFGLLPACISEAQLAQGKYADAVRQLIEPAAFNVFAAAPAAEQFDYTIDGPLPYASSSDRSIVPSKTPATMVPLNQAERGYFMLKLGNAILEWADVLYRSNQPESIMRARELYKAVLFLHGDDPEITPTWPKSRGKVPPFLPRKKSSGNPAVVGQTSRAKLGFIQINFGLNYYGASSTQVPPVRFRALKEEADRFASAARGAQTDFLGYMQQLDQLTVSEMTARTMVAKANASISIAQEQQKIAEYNVGEVQKQVDAINAQIVAKRAEIAKADDLFEQAKDFAGGMKDSISKLGDVAFAGEGASEPASAQTLSSGDVMKLAMKFGSGGGDLTAATGALGSSMAVAGPFAAFLYAGVTSMSALAAAAAKRLGDLKGLENSLPMAKALVEVKKRDVTIAKLAQDIAKADAQLGKDLLAFYSSRFLNRSFLVNVSEFSNRLMRRYVDLGGSMAWWAERALAFEQDRALAIISFDYFPRNLRGVTGADLLQLHLAELEAARIQGLSQTVPVKFTASLARDFPAAFGQVKKTGGCQFATSEDPLRLVHPGVFGYRIRNLTVSATYADPIQPHRGMLTNQGVSLVSRSELGTMHDLLRYPDALPLSEFRMRNDMWVFDLPDETLLPFEGSGIETAWELMLSKVGNANGFESLTDILITFDMRASYSASLSAQHISGQPTSVNRSILVSAKTMNPGALSKFRKDGGILNLDFDLGRLAHNPNESSRKTLNLILVAIGIDDAPFTATFSSKKAALSNTVTLERGIALSNAGVLAGGNAGVPLPLTKFTGLDLDQVFGLQIDGGKNPSTDFKKLDDVLLLTEYEATV